VERDDVAAGGERRRHGHEEAHLGLLHREGQVQRVRLQLTQVCGEVAALDLQRGSAMRWRLPLHHIQRGPAADPAHGARRADGGAEHLFPAASFHPLRCGGRRRRAPLPAGLLFIPSAAADGGGSVWWWDGGGELLFLAESSSLPLAQRTAVAVGGGGTEAAEWARPFGFLFFILLKTLCRESKDTHGTPLS
jgi:hypothetical protein